MVRRKSPSSNGFTSTRSAPRARASALQSSRPLCPPPLITMILGFVATCFNSIRTWIPSCSAMKISVTTTSVGSRRHSAIPSRPSGASRTVWPARSSMLRRAWRSKTSSSMMRIRDIRDSSFLHGIGVGFDGPQATQDPAETGSNNAALSSIINECPRWSCPYQYSRNSKILHRYVISRTGGARRPQVTDFPFFLFWRYL
ncbi:MAG: hypothetical protein EWM73_01865 [Nitrospira sp.]|nr:MAG: hypothetical protein EWM73_01865 [Nitrospira sp.]